jgi:hypothetical protein
VDPRAGLDDVERRKILPIPGSELQPLGRPARSQSLYRLGCPIYILSVSYFDPTEHSRHSSSEVTETVELCPQYYYTPLWSDAQAQGQD